MSAVGGGGGAGGGGGRRIKVLQDFLIFAATGYSVYYLISLVLRRLDAQDPEKSDREDLARRSNAILRRLDQNDTSLSNRNSKSTSKSTSDSPSDQPQKSRPSFLSSFSPSLGGSSSNSSGNGGGGQKQKGPRERMQLTPYEQKIVTEVVAPEDIQVTFSSIGGLEEIIDELRESVIYPLTHPHLFSSLGSSSNGGGKSNHLFSAPKGVLLYGPPGCGKTMLAKALAKESQACFINLHISTLTEKWYGDSNKMVNAVFSLAKKLQPSIIFIDEIDAVLRQRSAQDHEASAMVKAEFMTHWDGLLTSNSSSPSGGGTAGEDPLILVLGATNRINDIDEAILRRLPKKFHIPLPDPTQRKRILELLLKDSKLDEKEFDINTLVNATVGFSGSDLKEACRDAVMVPVREVMRKRREREKEREKRRESTGEGDGEEEEEQFVVRGVKNSDFFRKESGGKWAAMGMAGMAGLEGLSGIGLGRAGARRSPGWVEGEIVDGGDLAGDV